MKAVPKKLRTKIDVIAEGVRAQIHNSPPRHVIWGIGVGWAGGNSAIVFARKDEHGSVFHTLDEPARLIWCRDTVLAEVKTALARDSDQADNVIPFRRKWDK